MNFIVFRNVLILIVLINFVACETTSTPKPNSSFSVSSVDFGSDSTSQTVTLSNTGNASSIWTAVDYVENSANPEALPEGFEITANPTSGTIQAGGNQTITFSIDRNELALKTNILDQDAGLQSGTYKLELRFTIDGTQKSLDMSFTLSSQPNSNFSDSSIDFGSDKSSASVSLNNSGNAVSTWEVGTYLINPSNPEVLPNDFTINVNPGSGTVPAAESQEVVLSIDRTKLTALTSGTYQLELRFTVDGTQKSINLAFTLGGTTPPPSDGGYNIQIEFSGSEFTPSRQAVFQTAASIWAEAITGDLSDINIPTDIRIPANVCGFPSAEFKGVIDDMLIFANVAPGDGVGGVLASAGPLTPGRGVDGSGLPFAGCMTFDSADIAVLEANGSLQNTIVHEMGHVLGIGTRWESFSTGICSEPAGTGSPTFTGANSVGEWTTLNGGTPSGNVPIEDGGGPGTQCGHWDEETFFTELMTGFLNTAADPLSRLTIGSLKDLGYSVDLSKAEPYSLPSCSPNCTGLRSATHQGPWETVNIYTIPE